MKTNRIALTDNDPKYFWIRLTSLVIALGAGTLAVYAITLGRTADVNRPTSIGLRSPASAIPASPSDSTAGAYAAPASTERTVPAQGASVDKRGLHIVTFTFYDVGIEPDVLHTSKGVVAVLLEDRSGGTKGLVLERETPSGRVGVGRVDRLGAASPTQWRGRSEFRLEPGTYRVTDSSRPLNFAELIVDP